MRKIYTISFLLLIFNVEINISEKYLFQYPSIRKVDSINIYWDNDVNDSYRNLENEKDSSVIAWYDSQMNYANTIINNISNRDNLAKYLSEISNRSDYYISRLNKTLNNKYFYLKKLPSESKYKLYYRNSFDSKEELIFDPNDFHKNKDRDYVINYIGPSDNGRYVVISMTYSGREYSEAVIFDVKTKKVLPQVLDHCWLNSFYGVSWLPDSSGFIYLHFPNLYEEGKKSKHNTEAVLYKIGQNSKELKVLLSANNNKKLNIDKRFYPIVSIPSNQSKYIFANIVNVSNFFDRYYADIDDLNKGEINWKPLFKKEDKVYRTSGILVNDSLFFRSAKDASNLKINVVDLKTNVESSIIPENKNEVIKDFDITKDGLFYCTLKNGVQANLYKYSNGIVSNIDLPKESGKISIKSYDKSKSELIVNLTGWLSKSQRFSYNSKTKSFSLKDLKPLGMYPEFKDFVIKEVEVPSHDGTLVPLSMIYHKDIKLNGKNPVFMDGYGAYGDNMSPIFSPLSLAWVTKGGIYCTAHVRGGGEKGDAWHKDGMKTTKPNTWKDLIACMEYMIEERYTSNQHNAIWSSSAGGIMIGRAVTERPDLFKVAISEVGIMNPLRYEESSSGSNFKEFGTSKDSIECLGLIEMDSYLQIKDKTNYPATLVTAGMNDPRVTPWQSGKFIARLQEANKSDNPILFAVYKDSGHGVGTTVEQIYQEWANVFAFTLWQTGHPDFKLDTKAAFGNNNNN